MRLQKVKLDWDSLGFNLIPTRSMYSAMCRLGENWSNGSLIPFGNIGIISSCSSLKLWTRSL